MSMSVYLLQLGVVFLEQGKASQALAYLDKALEFNPDHEQALLNSAILLQELGRADFRVIARERLLKLLAIDGGYCDKLKCIFVPFIISTGSAACVCVCVDWDKKMMQAIYYHHMYIRACMPVI